MKIDAINLKQSFEQIESVLQRSFQLDKLYFPNPWTWKNWQELLENSDRYQLNILTGGPKQMVGFALFHRIPEEKLLHLLKVVVHPDHRQEGGGKSLLKEALTQSAHDGIERCILEVEVNNANAQKLYESMDFQMVHRKLNFYGAGRDGLVMELVI